MTTEEYDGKGQRSAEAEPESAAQLRREAAKARLLGDAAFGEEERRRLIEVAATLDREAVAIETALASQRKAGRRR